MLFCLFVGMVCVIKYFSATLGSAYLYDLAHFGCPASNQPVFWQAQCRGLPPRTKSIWVKIQVDLYIQQVSQGPELQCSLGLVFLTVLLFWRFRVGQQFICTISISVWTICLVILLSEMIPAVNYIKEIATIYWLKGHSLVLGYLLDLRKAIPHIPLFCLVFGRTYSCRGNLECISFVWLFT